MLKEYLEKTYGNKEVAQLRVDMTDTLTVIYKA